MPGKVVSSDGSFEITNKDEIDNELVRNLLSINGVEGIFLGKDFISINKYDDFTWDEIKHIVISLINDFYSDGKECVIEKNLNEINDNLKTFIKNQGFDLDFEKCINDKKIEDYVLNDRIEGTKKFKVNATPTIIINNKKFEKPLNYKNLKKSLEKLI